MMSWTTATVPVFTSVRWAQERMLPSPEGVQAAEAEVHSRPLRQIASSILRSPESMVPGPAVTDAGGESWPRMVRSVAEASVTLAAAGVPVMRIRVSSVRGRPEVISKVARYWSFTAVNEWAGRTVWRLRLSGKAKADGDTA